MNSRRPHILRDERGIAASEFALILPILTVLMFAFYEAGRMYWNYNIIQSSARDAARYAARLPVTCDGAGNGAFEDVNDTAEVQNLTRTGTVDGTADPVVSGWTDNSDVGVSIACVDNSAGDFTGLYTDMGEIPTISISAAAPSGTMFGSLFGIDLQTITVSNAQPWTE